MESNSNYRMEGINDYERKVIKLLTSEVLNNVQLENVLSGGESIDFEDHNGSGYFINIHHFSLPKERIVCDKPIVIGELENITCGFVIFIENGALSLDCSDWGESNIPVDFRKKDVQIRPVKIEDGKFISI